MAETADLLIEIGTEELPPKALQTLSNAFEKGVASGLENAALSFGTVRSFAAPRRLGLLIEGLLSAQQDRAAERKGPALKAAFDAAGNPTKAAEGFARSCGVSVSELQQVDTPKGAWLVYQSLQQGQSAAELLPGIVNQALAGLPIPKRMRWGERSEEFVRPVHWVVLLLGNAVVACEILGQQAGNCTRGHRFHHPEPIEIPEPKAYPELLRDRGKVIADFAARSALIRQQTEQIAADAGARAVIDPALLEEVTALNEWPVAVMGGFDERFLEVPPEVLVEAMQDHQKYFPVVDQDGKLLPRFITISNIESRDPEQVRKGNERVIRPRFSDAAFFWEQDLKHPLEHQIPRLKQVVFQDKLGSLHDKTLRVAALAERVAEGIGLDKAIAWRAAELCKCDLMTEMVYEFPSLQGIMGRYYAARKGEHPQVVAAMDEVYQPRHAGDALPATDCGRAVAIADRIDTLTGIFAIGQQPTGAKDPFGLRRAALGVLRILIETPLDLDLKALLHAAADKLPEGVDGAGVAEQVFDYMMDRMKAYYADRNVPGDAVEAVLACRPVRPADFDRRVRAVTAFLRLDEAAALAAANKRIRNILRKSEEGFPARPNSALFSEHGEKELAAAIEKVEAPVRELFAQGEYTAALQRLAGLRGAVDRFFDEVMVNCEQEGLRLNRLALLNSLSELFLGAADLSRLQVEEKP